MNIQQLQQEINMMSYDTRFTEAERIALHNVALNPPERSELEWIYKEYKAKLEGKL